MTVVYLGQSLINCLTEWHLGEGSLFEKWFNAKNGTLWPVLDNKDLLVFVNLAHVLYAGFTFYKAIYIFQGSIISILNTYVIPDAPFNYDGKSYTKYLL